MGANLVGISLVIGLSVVIAGSVKADGKISSQNFWFVSFIAILPILLAVDGLISRGDGLLLLVIFGLYLVKIFNDKEYFHKEMDGTEHTGMRSFSRIVHHASRFLFAIFVLLAGSFAFIWSAVQIIEEYFEANFILFGIVFVALGTALPELVFGIRATRQGHGNAMLGNAVGSIAFNAAAVVGIVSIIHPIVVNFSVNLILISVFLVVSLILFHFFVYTRGRINRKEGFVLLLLYGIFLAIMLSQCVECLV
jgi:cation:H+ antiporter